MNHNPLQIDNTAIVSSTCPARHYYRHICNITKPGTSAALAFGAAVHAGIAHWLKGNPEQESIQVAIAQFPTIESNNPYEWRTPARCENVLQDYFASRLHTRPEMVMLGNPPQPLVEVEFSLPMPIGPSLAKKLEALGYSHLEYCGIIDDVQMLHGEICPEDHKTTSSTMDVSNPKGSPEPILSANFGNKFSLDGGFCGYVWACRKLVDPNITQFILDGIGLLKPLKENKPTDKRNAFGRVILDFPDWKIAQWEANVVARVESMLDNRLREVYPMHTDCCHQYNSTCQFHELCDAPESLREGLKALYVESAWKPLSARETEATASTQ